MTARDALAAIRERAEAATEGPWQVEGLGDWVGPIGIPVAPDDGGLTVPDAEFVARARTDVPALVEVVEAVVRLVRFDECHHTVVDADGYEGPCDRTAFALRIDPDGGPYPVCLEHAKDGPLLALGQIRDLIESKLEGR